MTAIFASSRLKVRVMQDFPVPVEYLFSYLSEHESLQKLFAPCKVERLSDGHDTRNGIGSSRRFQPMPFLTIEETVTRYVRNELIECRLTKGTLLRDHVSTMRFAALEPNRSRVDYFMKFESLFPGSGQALRRFIHDKYDAGLASLAVDRSFLLALPVG